MTNRMKSNRHRRFVSAVLAAIAFMCVAQIEVAAQFKPGDAVWANPGEKEFKLCTVIRYDNPYYVVNCGGTEDRVVPGRVITRRAQPYKPGDEVWARTEGASSSVVRTCTVVSFEKSADDQGAGRYALDCGTTKPTLPEYLVEDSPSDEQKFGKFGKVGSYIAVLLLLLMFVPIFKCTSLVEKALIRRFGTGPLASSIFTVAVYVIPSIFTLLLFLFLSWAGFIKF